MLGYKGFNSNMICMYKHYKVGESYHEDETVLCHKGMHFCIDPFDVFTYYSHDYNNRYCLVEADNVSDEEAIDSKRVCKDLKIIKEFTYREYYKEICRYHRNTNGIINEYGTLSIFSDNNIIYCSNNTRTYNVCGNNNLIVYDDSVYFRDFHLFGHNNIVVYKWYRYGNQYTAIQFDSEMVEVNPTNADRL